MNFIRFGTDGIRGKVGQVPITFDDFNRLGQACRDWLQQQQLPLTVAIGWDTRSSGSELAQAFAKGFLHTSNASVTFLHVVPTPAVSFFVKQEKISLGVSITASHNPYTDNGLKLFKSSGSKLLRREETIIEQLCTTKIPISKVSLDSVQKISGKDYYLNHLKKTYSNNFIKSKRIVLDTANGATTYTTLPLLKELSTEVIALGDQPNGININENCGSEHTEQVEKIVKETHSWLGFAHDGDGDRLVVIDENGERVDGDEILGILAIDLYQQNRLKNNKIVVTQQSNSGLKASLAAYGIKTIVCGIGDREVFYALEQEQSNFGGENSGHIILRDEAPTGDGLRVLLHLLKLAQIQPICERKKAIKLLPKCEHSMLVSHKIPLEELQQLQNIKQKLQHLPGRILIRYSGTENKLRFLVEAETEALCQEHMSLLQTAAKSDFKIS